MSCSGSKNVSCVHTASGTDPAHRRRYRTDEGINLPLNFHTVLQPADPLNVQSPMVTFRTTTFNIQKFCVGNTVYSYVLYGPENTQRLFLYTALNNWFL